MRKGKEREMTETLKIKLNDEQMAKIIYKVTEKMMLDANRIEVVRCKDCKYLEENSICTGGVLGGYGQMVMFDDFCSYGERKDED